MQYWRWSPGSLWVSWHEMTPLPLLSCINAQSRCFFTLWCFFFYNLCSMKGEMLIWEFLDVTLWVYNTRAEPVPVCVFPLVKPVPQCKKCLQVHHCHSVIHCRDIINIIVRIIHCPAAIYFLISYTFSQSHTFLIVYSIYTCIITMSQWHRL